MSWIDWYFWNHLGVIFYDNQVCIKAHNTGTCYGWMQPTLGLDGTE